jgi:HSP20 family molecular chaperone IbpA
VRSHRAADTAKEQTMPEPDRRPPDEQEWRDIHLDDIIRGVGSFISLVSSVVESVETAVGTGRSHELRAPATQTAPARIGAGAALAGVRDPLVDLFDEGDEIVVVVEWPYVDEGQLQVEVQDDVLSLTIGGEWPYSTDLLLPGSVEAASMRQIYRNGLTEVRLRRADT